MKDRRGRYAGVFFRYVYYHAEYQQWHRTIEDALEDAYGRDCAVHDIVDARTNRVIVGKDESDTRRHREKWRRPVQPLRAERYDSGYKRRRPKPKPKPLVRTGHFTSARGRYREEKRWGELEDQRGFLGTIRSDPANPASCIFVPNPDYVPEGSA